MSPQHTAHFYSTPPKGQLVSITFHYPQVHALFLYYFSYCQSMFLPPDHFARADSEQRRHAPNKPPAVAVIMCILVAVIMMLAPLFYGKGVLGRCFTTRASHPPRERIVFLTPEALELVPITKYRAWREGKHDRSLQKGTNSSITSFESSQECSICTEEFLEDVRLRSQPCGHSFHPDCIDPWLLERSVTCPMW
jgi:hypothetical protein